MNRRDQSLKISRRPKEFMKEKRKNKKNNTLSTSEITSRNSCRGAIKMSKIYKLSIQFLVYSKKPSSWVYGIKSKISGQWFLISLWRYSKSNQLYSLGKPILRVEQSATKIKYSSTKTNLNSADLKSLFLSIVKPKLQKSSSISTKWKWISVWDT